MKLKLSMTKLQHNLSVLKQVTRKSGLLLSVMVKHQFWCDSIAEALKDERVYTTGTANGWIDIYNTEGVHVVDAFDKREGISLEEAKLVEVKDTAIVNFCCCNGKIPTEDDIVWIGEYLHAMGFATVSVGGSLMLDYKANGADEIRVGEALLTGYSSEPYGAYYPDMVNPFEVEFDVWSVQEGSVVVREGFMKIGGFTNATTACVNTDFTVINIGVGHRYQAGDKIVLKPDYYTIFKYADRYSLHDIEVTE